MPIVLNGSTGITANNLGVETIVDTAGTGAPSVPNGFEQMFVLPVGTLMWFTGTTAPGGYLVADGSLHSRAAYPDLWSWIVTSGNLAVSDSAWDEGQYSPGDGATTFRVPKVDDRFIRGKSATRNVGLVEEDQFKSHTHPERASGAGGALLAPTLTGTGVNDLETVLSTSAVGGTETRPKALTMLPCIKAFDSVIEPSILNAAEMVSTINGKLDKSDNIVLGTSVAASGTAVDFVGIPEGVKRITVMFDGVSTNGTSAAIMRIGDSLGISATGYAGVGSYVATSAQGYTNIANATAHLIILTSMAAASTYNGRVVLEKLGGNTWLLSGNATREDSTLMFTSGCSKSLANTLSQIKITTANGTDQFDAGTINISWEF